MLVLTGGEALYADMGHFGRRPIRLAWFGVAMPALLLNYIGQGALLLRDPAGGREPLLPARCPEWALWPMVAIATAAAIVRLAGPHLRRLLAHQPGHPARLRARASPCGTPPAPSSGRSTSPR